jgi:dTDP-4-amino-4,6-dideoxygalactose transaminase
MDVPFNRPFMTGGEIEYIRQAHFNKHLSGNGEFTKKCQGWLEQTLGAGKALLTHSGTAALEMAALLAEIGPGDEVIMPSFTFVSTANAFVLRGAVPVFVDIRPDTLNLDESLVEAAITPRTRAIVPVHYAGVACAMDELGAIARRHDLLLIEDAAQAVGSTYGGRPLGTIGELAAISFHETKNVISGEGGAILINDDRFADRAEILWEKGTNRAGFFRGEVDKYTWMDVGSSFLPCELVAAFLWAQLEQAENLTQRRLECWWKYHAAFAGLEASGRVRRPVVPEGCGHNGHIYYLLLADLGARTALMAALKARGVSTTFHYVPLHDSPAGRRYGRAQGDLPVTCAVSDSLVRLPLWIDMRQGVHVVIDEVIGHLAGQARKRSA